MLRSSTFNNSFLNHEKAHPIANSLRELLVSQVAMETIILLNLLYMSLQFVSFASLLVFFLPWPLISIALIVQFLSTYFFSTPWNPDPESEVYLPRLPIEVYGHIASFLDRRQDLVRFTFASQSTYNAGNPFLYRRIIMDEHSSIHVPWFRRRLFRLHDCLTGKNALYIHHADFSFYHDVDEEYLLSILQRCKRLTSLILPAMQKPIEGFITRRPVDIKQPCFLTERLSIPIYDTITSLTWMGPFIPLRGSDRRYGANGKGMLSLFPNLRSLTIRVRPDKYTGEGDPWVCLNVFGTTAKDIHDLSEDLKCMASSCPYLEEMVLPFWEPVYSLVPRSLFESFGRLQRIRFLAVDSPAKWTTYGSGLLKFIFEMHEIGVDICFDNPYQTPFEVKSLIDEIDLEGDSGDYIRRFSQNTELEFRTSRVFSLQGDHLNRLVWINPSTLLDNTQMTLRWDITPLAHPRLFIHPVFTGVLFQFDSNVGRYDASSFLKFHEYMTDVVEMPHVRKVAMDMSCVNAFYLAFPLFMQYYGKRVLTLCLERLLLS